MKRILKALIVGAMCIPASLFAKNVQDVQPAFWWSGMQASQLQILLRGENFSASHISVNARGVTVDSIVKPTNPQYALLYLTIKDAPAQTFQITIKDGKRTERLNYELRERNSAVKAQGFDKTDVLYLIMPDRFANGNPANDVVKGMRETTVDRNEPFGRHGGDLQGITDHMDYFTDLGVTTLWLNPTQENDMPQGSYHGYAITNYYETDPRLGTNADMAKLVETAHNKGLKVVMDMVFNHCGAENPLFRNRPSDDWFNYNSQYVQTTFKTASAMDPYATVEDRKLAVDGWFTEAMPDWNQRNPHVAQYLIQSSIWWIEYAGIDGIRQDTHPYADFGFMAQWCKAVMTEYPTFNIVGETWLNNPTQIAYWQRNSALAAPLNSQLPTVMDFPLFFAMGKAFDETTTDWDSGLFRLYDLLSQDYVYPDTDRLLTFLDNHDTSRFFRNAQDVANMARYKQALTFLLTTRGIPQLYYGMEVLMAADKSEGDGNLRRDMLGGWKGDAHNVFTSAGRTKTEQQAYELTQKLLHWRRAHPDLIRGRLTHCAIRDGVYVYARQWGENTALIIMNGTDEEKDLNLSFCRELIPNGDGIELFTDKKIRLEDKIRLPKRETLFLNY